MNKILIFKIGAIGDVLMTTPFVRQLYKNKKDTKIDYMVGSKAYNILIGNPYINEIGKFDESCFPKKDIIKLLHFFWKIKKVKKQYNSVIIFDKHWIFSLCFRLAGYKNIIGFDRMGKSGKFLDKKLYRDGSKRELEYNLDILKFFNITPDYNDQKYDFIFDKTNKALNNIINGLKNDSKKIIGISTGGGNNITNKVHGNKDCRRRHLNNRYKLTNNLLNKGYVVLLLGSNSDRLLDINHKNFYNMLGNFSLRDSIYLISKIDKVICHESGFMHLVGCTQTPMIVLAGPTNPYRLSPNRSFIKIIRKEKKECYDIYGNYDECTGQEIDKITVKDVLNLL